jgi:hypothetical protein
MKSASRLPYNMRRRKKVPAIAKPRVIFVTQLVDPEDPVLGFVPSWISALARKCDHLAVVANEVRNVPDGMGAEVISLGKETGARRLQRGLRYEAAIARLASSLRPDAIFAHMCPVYLNLGIPVARLFGLRGVLWFAHPADHLSLRLAERLAHVVLTSLPGAYPRAGPKVRAIGQGIDTDRLAYVPPIKSATFRLLALGRTSPSKGFHTVVHEVRHPREAGIDV